MIGPCPKCNSEYAYEMSGLFVCPECAHEWTALSKEEESIKDSNGTVLQNGDDVIITKDLKVKGYKQSIKQGTKIKGIRLVENPIDGHDIDCKIDGFGAMSIKSEFVKKA